MSDIPTLKEYTVRWEIQIYATSHREAAQEISKDFFQRGHEANCFEVKLFSSTEGFELIDLSDDDTEDL